MLSLRKNRRPRTLGLALGGGGVRGLAAVPILKLLDELGIEIQVVSGTSMGAIIGALYSLGLRGQEIEDRVRNHIVLRNDDLRAVYRKRKHLLRWLRVFGIATRRGGILSADGAFQHLFKEISEHDFTDTKRTFSVIATHYWSGEEVVLDSGPLMPAVKASMALPGIFHPEVIDGRLLFDGGLVNNLPYDQVMKKADFCIAVDVINPPRPDEDERPGSYEAMIGAVDIMQVKMLELRMQISRPDIFVRPDIKHVRLLDFHQIEHVLECGEKAAAGLRQQIETDFPWLLDKPN